MTRKVFMITFSTDFSALEDCWHISYKRSGVVMNKEKSSVPHYQLIQNPFGRGEMEGEFESHWGQ